MRARKLNESEHPPFGSSWKRIGIPLSIYKMLENLKDGEILEITPDDVPLQALYFLFLYWAKSKPYFVYKYQDTVHVQKT